MRAFDRIWAMPSFWFRQKIPMTTSENVKIDRDTPLDVLKQEAERGNPEAQYLLGVAYSEGNGIDQELVEAVKWLQSAAKQGYAPAMQTLFTITRDVAQWGSPGFQFRLGLHYYTGCGVDKDENKAVEWWQVAAEQGHEKATKALRQIEASKSVT